jgi:hypothetical protein
MDRIVSDLKDVCVPTGISPKISGGGCQHNHNLGCTGPFRHLSKEPVNRHFRIVHLLHRFTDLHSTAKPAFKDPARIVVFAWGEGRFNRSIRILILLFAEGGIVARGITAAAA